MCHDCKRTVDKCTCFDSACSQVMSAQPKPAFGTPLEECNDIEKLRVIAERLWSLLDDIDTASDMLKPREFDDYRQFYSYALKKAADRGKQLESDGYHLYLPAKTKGE